MKIAAACAVMLLLAESPVLAAAAADTSAVVQPADRPSDASLHHLLDVMQAKKLVESTAQMVDGAFTTSLNKLVDNPAANPTPEQRKVIEKSRARIKELYKDLLSWEVMEALYLRVYGDTFTQTEIDGMTAFYDSPAGRAVIVKLPLALKNTMAEMQKRMEVLIPKIQQVAKEAADEIKAQGAAKAAGKSG